MKKKYSILLVLLFVAIFFVPACSKASILENTAKHLSTYNIEAFYNKEEHTVSGKVELLFVNHFATPLSELVFSLSANGYSQNATFKPVSAANIQKTYPNGISYGGITVNDVTVNSVAIEPVLGGQDNTSLTLPLNETIYEKDRAKICLNFIAQLPNANLRFGYGLNTINITGFFPILAVHTSNGWQANPYSSNGDPFFSECANYDVTFVHDSSFVLASTGSQILKQEFNGTTTQFIKARAVRDFALVLSKEFQVLEQKVNDTQIKYYYFNDANPEQSLHIACQSIQTFEKLFGDYPYPILSVVQANFLHGGMEYPQLVMISNELKTREEQNEVIVHEIAHQWWYGLVGSDAFSYGWMDEGLTEFSTALFFDKNPEYNVTREQMVQNANKSYALFLDVYTEVFGKIDTSMNRKLNDYKTEPEYVYVAYVKSMLMYDSLYELIGEKKFLTALQNLKKDKQFQNIQPEDMIAYFQQSNRTNLENFFASWINGDVMVIDNLKAG